MSAIALLTGQQDTVDQINEAIRSQPQFKAHIEGLPGCGKSWALKKIASAWTSAKAHSYVHIIGNRSNSARALSVFHYALAPLNIDLQLKRTGRSALAKIGSMVPVAGGFISYLMEAGLQDAERRQRSRTPYLNASEQDILFQLQSVAGNGELLIIADDINYWDIDSLRLLTYLHSPELISVYQFLGRTRFLISSTTGSGSQNPELVSAVLNGVNEKWNLKYIAQEDLPALLVALGLAADVPDDVLKIIYAVCAGHLELLRRVAEYLAMLDQEEYSLLNSGVVSPDKIQFMSSLLQKRFEHVGREQDALNDFLRCGAVIGNAFLWEEICWMCGRDSAQIRPSVNLAEQLRIVEVGPVGISFVHETIRECLLRSLGEHAQKLHLRMSQCLSELRPSDYYSRAEHAYDAAEYETAAELYFAALLQLKRDQLTVASGLEESIECLIEVTGAKRIASPILDAHNLFLQQKYQEAIELLQGTEHTYRAIYCAERDLLWSQCLVMSSNSANIQLATQMLARWVSLRESEPDLWCRIQLMSLIVYVLVDNISEALIIERDIADYLLSVMHSDPRAISALNILRRKANALHSAGIARERCGEAVAYFGPNAESDSPRNDLQYYMALCNLSGLLIVLGEFEAATKAAQLAIGVRQNGNASLPRPTVAINNLVVAGVLGEVLDVSTAVQLLEKAIAEEKPVADRHIMLSNLAILFALELRLEEALDLSMRIQQEITEARKDGPFYFYLIHSNLSALLYLAGRKEEGMRLWKSLEDRIPPMPHEERVLLKERQRLQLAAFEDIVPGDVTGWQRYIVNMKYEADERGRNLYSFGFLMSDIQFWSDS